MLPHSRWRESNGKIMADKFIKPYVYIVCSLFLMSSFVGYITGYTIGNLISFASSKVGIYKISLAIIPHGIFEVPAVLIAASYGLWWGVKNYRKFRYKDAFPDDFSLPIKRYINIVIPLLIIGAFVEAYITPFIIRLFI